MSWVAVVFHGTGLKLNCYISKFLILSLVSSAAKQARLKQAKDEAEKEIAEFRAYMEAEFQRKVEQVNKRQIVFEKETNCYVYI